MSINTCNDIDLVYSRGHWEGQRHSSYAIMLRLAAGETLFCYPHINLMVSDEQAIYFPGVIWLNSTKRAGCLGFHLHLELFVRKCLRAEQVSSATWSGSRQSSVKLPKIPSMSVRNKC